MDNLHDFLLTTTIGLKKFLAPLKMKSMDEALEWAKRIPNDLERPDMEGQVDIRPIFEAEDFGPEITPELRKLEERLRTKAERLKQS